MHLFTQSALFEALGWSLLNSIWQMALLWIVYRFICACTGKKTAAFRHLMALLLLSVGMGWALVSTIRGAGMPPPGHFEGLPATALGYIDQAIPVLSVLYLTVLFGLLIRTAWQYRESGRLQREGLQKTAPSLRLFVEESRLGLGIQKKVSVWLSSLVEAPLTIGFLKPVILLPVSMIMHLDARQVEAILIHELAHIKRNDYLLNLLITVVENLFFFNPFARLLIRTIRKEREHDCDDKVMQFRYPPHSYASALLALARTRENYPALAMAATGREEGLLLQRIRRILDQPAQPGRRGRPFQKPVLLLLSAALSIFVVLFPVKGKKPATPLPAPAVASLIFLPAPPASPAPMHRIPGNFPGSPGRGDLPGKTALSGSGRAAPAPIGRTASPFAPTLSLTGRETLSEVPGEERPPHIPGMSPGESVVIAGNEDQPQPVVDGYGSNRADRVRPVPVPMPRGSFRAPSHPLDQSQPGLVYSFASDVHIPDSIKILLSVRQAERIRQTLDIMASIDWEKIERELPAKVLQSLRTPEDWQALQMRILREILQKQHDRPLPHIIVYI